MRIQTFVAVLLVAAALAGCSSGKKETPLDTGDAPALEVTATTGGIRGIVVDQAVVPVSSALVVLSGGSNRTTGNDGQFNFTGLEAGDYFVSVSKPGYKPIQSAANVVAGVPDPPIVKVLLERISSAQPYLDFFKLDGFYECAQSFFFVVDTCDWEYRTGWQTLNDSGHPIPAPRSAFNYLNTQEIDVAPDTFSIVQEAFWSDDRVSSMWIMVDEWPIDPGCDCSDTFGGVEGPSGELQRIDRYLADGSNNTDWHPAGFASASSKPFPAGTRVVARGFLPPADVPVQESQDPNTWYGLAQNFQFTIITSMFHNYVAPEGWTFQTQDQYKIG